MSWYELISSNTDPMYMRSHVDTKSKVWASRLTYVEPECRKTAIEPVFVTWSTRHVALTISLAKSGLFVFTDSIVANWLSHFPASCGWCGALVTVARFVLDVNYFTWHIVYLKWGRCSQRHHHSVWR